MIARRQRQLDARAEEPARGQIVVAREAGAVRHRHRRREGERVEPVDRADVAAAVGHVAQRRGIAAVVSLRAVRQAEIVAVTRRHARRVGPGDEPGRDIALGQRAAHRPVRLIADRRRERDIGDAAREIVGAEQLLRAVERTGRQQIELTGERHAGEEVGGNPSDAPADLPTSTAPNALVSGASRLPGARRAR